MKSKYRLISRAQLVTLSSRVLRLKLLARELATISISVTALGLSSRAQFYLPISPIPFTLQTMILIYLILLLGKRAWRAVLAYLICGLAGLPVFALGGGPWYVFSPTFGYLMGFLLASLIGGLIIKDRVLLSLRTLLISATASMASIYIMGALYLAIWLTLLRGFSVHEAIVRAILVGVLPFIVWDALKAYIAVLLYRVTVKLLIYIEACRYFRKQYKRY
jgi:biotin transport system substrate-specific component